AEEAGIDPAQVQGTGKGGRVLKADLLAGKPATPSPVTAKGAGALAEAAGPRSTRKKMTPLRARIAERLLAAQQEAAILTTFNEADMTNVMALRAKHQERFTAKHGIKLGFMSFFVKAVVHALRAVPALNARLDGDEIVENHFYD